VEPEQDEEEEEEEVVVVVVVEEEKDKVLASRPHLAPCPMDVPSTSHFNHEGRNL
jgi:hypothetical protein